METSRFRQNFKRLGKSTAYSIKNDPKDGSVKISLPCLTIHDINRAEPGNIGVWSIIEWISHATILVFEAIESDTGSAFADIDKLSQKGHHFTQFITMTTENELYKILNDDQPTSLSVTVRLRNIGNTSYSLICSLVDETSGRNMATMNRQFVYVDKTTRKPAPLPDWWKTKYQPLAVGNEKMVLPSLEVPMKNVFKHSLRASWNDIDSLRHINFLSYIKFCLDAAMEAIGKRFYVGFSGDIYSYSVKAVRLSYFREGNARDELTVITWQDYENPMILNFSIDRDGKTLFRCSLEFFPRSHL